MSTKIFLRKVFSDDGNLKDIEQVAGIRRVYPANRYGHPDYEQECIGYAHVTNPRTILYKPNEIVEILVDTAPTRYR